MRMIDIEKRVSQILGRKFRDGQYVTVKEKRKLCGILCIGTVEIQCPRLHQALSEWTAVVVQRGMERVKRESGRV
jgi:hypothetical protein